MVQDEKVTLVGLSVDEWSGGLVERESGDRTSCSPQPVRMGTIKKGRATVHGVVVLECFMASVSDACRRLFHRDGVQPKNAPPPCHRSPLEAFRNTTARPFSLTGEPGRNESKQSDGFPLPAPRSMGNFPRSSDGPVRRPAHLGPDGADIGAHAPAPLALKRWVVARLSCSTPS